MKKRIPTGISNYQRLREEDYYTVDKSLMIKEFLERGSQATLITRPRRFGKTLNMSMMAEFFDITKDSKKAFEGTDIMKTEYAKEMSQYPTIFVSFASAKGGLEEAVKFIKREISNEYKRYAFIFETVSEFDQPFYNIIRKSLNHPDDSDLKGVSNSLAFLTEKLNEYYNKKAMLFIDEYDTPFIEAHIHGYYEDIRSGLASLLHTALKDNNHLQYAMITGIQRVAKENIFSDLNNLKVFTVADKQYSQYFGFTESETKAILEYYDLELNDGVKHMYDGYLYGGQEIYNPWSIVNYVDTKELLPYWVNTSANQMIKNAMGKVEPSFKEDFETLVKTGSITTTVNMNTSFYEHADSSSLWGLFVNAGYLTIEEMIDLEAQTYKLKIPNRELLYEFKSFTAFHLNVNVKVLNDLYRGIIKKDSKLFLKSYQRILIANASYFDLIQENSYHMLLFGLCLYTQNDYEVLSNQQAGKGRSDITLKARRTGIPSYVIELKHAKKEDYEKKPEILKDLAMEAIEQIKEMQYDVSLTGEIIHIALAHHGKNVEMLWIHK